MRADKGQFDEVLQRMLETPPQKNADIKAGNKITPSRRKLVAQRAAARNRKGGARSL